MTELVVGVRYVSRNEIPSALHAICPPPLQVLWLTASANLNVVNKLEEKAISLTDSFPLVRNDFDDPHLSDTTTARVTHALEHIVVLEWLINGFIKPDLLESGSIAVTAPGYGPEGEDIAAVWMREGIVSSNLFSNSILKQILAFDGNWYYER